MAIFERCAMCGQNKKLENSHIIPRSYFRSLKGGSGQLFSVSTSENGRVQLTNSDPKEPLLCRDCEQYLSVEFECYGTRLLKDKSKVKRKKDSIIFNGFKYKKFYLYLISILWRASISKHSQYSSVSIGAGLENLLSHCVFENKLKINTSLRLDHFVKISLFRLIDKSGQLSDEIIRKTMMSIGVEAGKNKEDGFVYFFMVDGFLIVYHFSSEKDIHSVRTKKNFGQIRNSMSITVPISDISNFKQVTEGFAAVTKKAVEHQKQ